MKPLIQQKNMFRGVLLLLCLALVGNVVFAQTIHLSLPFHTNKKVTLVAANGIRKDTLQQIVLDNKGNGVFDLRNIKTKPGLVGLLIRASSPPDVSYEWIYSPTENPTIVGNDKDEYVHHQNTQILNSAENQAMMRWSMQQYILKNKQDLGQQILDIYDSADAVARVLQTEQNNLKKQVAVLNDTLRQSPLFAATLLQIQDDIGQHLGQVWASNENRNAARQYFTTLDFEKIYHTGQWYQAINPCIEAYIKGTPNYEQFGKDIAKNLARIAYMPAYIDLADMAIAVCEQFSWWNDQKQVVDFLLMDNRLGQYPESQLPNKLKKLAAIQRLREGNSAPDLIFNKTNTPYALSNQNDGNITKPQAEIEILPADQFNKQANTLLIFHESGCGHCEEALNELKQAYPKLKQKDWRVISISADRDWAVFNNTTNMLPWQDKYCDLKGFTGINFKNYAVLGTPTIFVIDSNGKIKTKTALVKDAIY
jgi:hypothetical protein